METKGSETGKDEHPCKYCNYVAYDDSLLRTHEEKVHNEFRSFRCKLKLNKTRVSSMIPSTRPTVPQVGIISFTRRLFS